MFDSTSWPEPPQPSRLSRGGLWAALVCGCLAVAVAAAGAAIPQNPTAIIRSPDHLRQIEVFTHPSGTIDFYLANAGFRDPHKHRLIASVSGATSWQVQWQGEAAARFSISPATAKITQHPNPGITPGFALNP
ncbi:MAG: hypothetical protein B7Y73_05155 [Acidocella sp. 35-58-6]|nr:MAG: hypothetical protein B7Y73_05155 [Acidocella sp. 35-58-6]